MFNILKQRPPSSPARSRAPINDEDDALTGEGLTKEAIKAHVPGSLRKAKKLDSTRINRVVNGLRILQEDAPHARGHVPRTYGLMARNYSAETIYKVSTGISGTAEALFRLIMDVERAPQWDAAVERIRVVQQLDVNSHVLHIEFKHNTAERNVMSMWPLWTRPRDLCVMRHWRREQDGSFVILYQSTTHLKCPRKSGVVRAHLHGSGYTIAPRIRHDGEEKNDSLLTYILHIDLMPNRLSLAWQRLNRIDLLEDLLMNVLGLRDVMQEQAYLSSHLADEFFRTDRGSPDPYGLDDAREPSVENFPSEEGTPSRQKSGRAAGASGRGGSLDPAFWEEPDISQIKVRGLTYKRDRVKVKADFPAFRTLGVDFFELPAPELHIAQRRESLMQTKECLEQPFVFVIQLMFPGPPHLTIVIYCAPHAYSPVRGDGSPFSHVMSAFLDGSDQDRSDRFKVIPRVVEGSWLVKQTVGNTPTILGKKVRQSYSMGSNYMEVDVDIGSSSIAAAVLAVCVGVTKNLVIDVVFVLEGWCEEELPEKVLGSVRFNYLDIKHAALKLTSPG